MSKKMIRVVCIVLVVLLVLGLVAVVVPFSARAVTQAEIDALQAQREQIRGQARDIQEQIDTLQSEITTVTERKTILDQQVGLASEDIRLIDDQIAVYDEMIGEKAEELEAAEAAEVRQFNRYKARVRTMEETNGWTYVSILLKATSLTDFLSRLNDISDIVRSDQNLKEEYTEAKEMVAQVKADYEEVREEQRVKRTELESEKARLERQIDQANAVIRQLEDDVETYESAFEGKEAEQQAIQARIDAKVEELRKQKEAEEAARRAYEAAQRKAAAEAAAAAARQQQQQQQQQQSSGRSGTTGSTTTSTSSAASGTFTWPSNTTYLTSRFGYRVHPIFGTTKYHSGVDIAASYGTAVNAAAGGTVQIAEYSSSYGNYCVIYHSNGLTTLYGHMNSLPKVKVGESVSAGQTIGYVGSTGWSTGPHLHFEVRSNGSSVDPLGYFPNMSFTFAPDA